MVDPVLPCLLSSKSRKSHLMFANHSIFLSVNFTPKKEEGNFVGNVQIIQIDCSFGISSKCVNASYIKTVLEIYSTIVPDEFKYQV